MANRKKLTLEEVLNLNREPSIEEILKLSKEDYKKYRYYMQYGMLSLERILNLNRQPTLQELINLSDEDYCKYLYRKKIIPYIPEDYDLDEFECHTGVFYDPYYDPVFIIKEHIIYDKDTNLWNKSKGFVLNRSKDWNNLNVVDKGVIYFNYIEIEYIIKDENKKEKWYTCDYSDWTKKIIEERVFNINKLTIYKKNKNNRYLEPYIRNVINYIDSFHK